MMRMTASWFGPSRPTEYKVANAREGALQTGSPWTPVHANGGTVLAALKDASRRNAVPFGHPCPPLRAMPGRLRSGRRNDPHGRTKECGDEKEP
jgi:hypothetical protein